MATTTSLPSNGSEFNQTCSDRRVAVEVETEGGFIEIPTSEVTTHISKSGISHKNCATEVHFPAQWYEKSTLQYIDSFDPDEQSAYDTALVKWQDTETGQWYVGQYGYIRGVSGTGEDNRMRMWISDPADMVTAIPISTTYTTETTVAQILDDVSTVFENNTVWNSVETAVLEDRTVTAASDAEQTAESLAPIFTFGIPVDNAKIVKSKRQFKANRNTLADVLNWMTETVGGHWYFEATYEDGNPNLTLVYSPEIAAQQFTDHHTNGGVSARVIENDALREIVPVNAVRVNGTSDASIGGVNVPNPFSNDWPTATAVYEPLVRQSGQPMAPPVREVDTATITATEEKAKSVLKEMMTGAPQGDIKLYGKPDLEPYDRITSVPICRGQVQYDVPAMDYEVQKVEHTKTAGGEFVTRANVSIWVDPDGITVDSKWGKESAPTPDESEEDDSNEGGIISPIGPITFP